MAGRPTDYKPEYCQMLIDHMTTGLSFESFAAVVNCTGSTLYEWANKFDPFSEAKKIGFEQNRLFWEKKTIEATENGKQINSPVLIFNLKNRFPKEWRDRKELELDGEVKQSLNKESSDKIDALINALINDKD